MLVRRDTQGQPGKAGSFLGGALVSELDLRLGRTIEFGLLITMICLKEHFTWSKDQKNISVQKLKLLVDIKMISSKI